MDERQQPIIMLVDNSVEIAQAITDVLRLLHLRVVVCHDSQQAQTWIAEMQPDLLILDVEMPGLDGIDLFNRLRDGAAMTTPVIFFTGNPYLVKKHLVVYKARGAALIAKPNVDKLVPEVLQILEQDRAA